MIDEKMDKETLRWKQIEGFLETHKYIMIADAQKLCSVSAATANRILSRQRMGASCVFNFKFDDEQPI